MTSRACVLAASLLPALAVAQKQVPGETWRQTMSRERADMSLSARTTEMRTPIDQGKLLLRGILGGG
jgi:hypothetical protein